MATRPKTVSNVEPDPWDASRQVRGLKHGLYTDKTLILGESRDEYEELRAGLIGSLGPIGTIEYAIVDKIAFNLWRNRRLARAEWADSEAYLLPKNIARRADMDFGYGDIDPITGQQRTPSKYELEWARAVLAELENVEGKWIEDRWRIYLQEEMPLTWAYLVGRAEVEDYPGNEQYSQIVYMLIEGVGWGDTFQKLRQYCGDLLNYQKNTKEAEHLVDLVCANSISRHLYDQQFLKYQSTLDNQLSRLLRELRDAQRYRRETAHLRVTTVIQAEK